MNRRKGHTLYGLVPLPLALAALCGLLVLSLEARSGNLPGLAELLVVAALATATFLGLLIVGLGAVTSAQAFLESRGRRSERALHDTPRQQG